MFDYRTCAMIVLSLVVAAPALVFADVQNSRSIGDGFTRLDQYQLISVGEPGQPGNIAADVQLAQRWRGDWLNGSDFPVRGHAQFARADRINTAAGR